MRSIKLALAATLLATTPLTPQADAAAGLTDPSKAAAAGSVHSVAITGVTVPSGEYAIVVGYVRLATEATDIVAVTDGSSNAYAVQQCASGRNAFIAYFYYPSGISSTTITVANNTSTGGSATSSGLLARVAFGTGLSTTAYDSAVTQCTTASTMSSANISGTPSVSGELFVSVDGAAGSGTSNTPTPDAGWTSFGNTPDTEGTNIVMAEQYFVNSGSGTKTRTDAWPVTHTYSNMVLGFEPSGAVVVPKTILLETIP